jgi:hypothetical protein
MRHLLTTRRHVPLDRADDYLSAWSQVRAAAEAGGGRAWLFRGAEHEDHFLEFIEWRDAVGPLKERADVAAARALLDTFATGGTTEEWEDVA